MKIRMHRGGLSESMATVQEIPSTLEAVRAIIEPAWNECGCPPIETLEVKPYGFDSRIGWNTHLVTINDAAVAYTDGPLIYDPDGIAAELKDDDHASDSLRYLIASVTPAVRPMRNVTPRRKPLDLKPCKDS